MEIKRKGFRAGVDDRIPGPWNKVATFMWEEDGKPEVSFGGLADGEVGFDHYRNEARDVLMALDILGYKVVKKDEKQPRHRRPPERWTRDDKATRDLLELVSIEVDLATIAGWTDEQVKAAEKWAGNQHLRASDNPVRRVPKPDFLPDYAPVRGI